MVAIDEERNQTISKSWLADKLDVCVSAVLWYALKVFGQYEKGRFCHFMHFVERTCESFLCNSSSYDIVVTVW